jgi:HlyD family secretion protein
LQKTLIDLGIIPPPAAPGDVVITTRTLYRFPGGHKDATPEPVSVKAGITDGAATEIISGLNEGDVIITSVTIPGTAGAAPAPGGSSSRSGSSNPFSSRRF